MSSFFTSNSSSHADTTASSQPVANSIVRAFRQSQKPPEGDVTASEVWEARHLDIASTPQRLPIWVDWVTAKKDGTTQWKRVVYADNYFIEDPDTKATVQSIAEKLSKEYRKKEKKEGSTPGTVLVGIDLSKKNPTGGSAKPPFSEIYTSFNTALEKKGLAKQFTVSRNAHKAEIRDYLKREGKWIPVSDATSRKIPPPSLLLFPDIYLEDDCKDMWDGTGGSFREVLSGRGHSVDPEQVLAWVQLGSDLANLGTEWAGMILGS